MSMDLERKDYSCAPDNFMAGTMPVTTTVKKAGGVLKAHAPVKIAEGQVTAVASGDLAHLTGLYGITADSAESGTDAVIYVAGDFFKEGLALESEVTADALEVPFRNIGIYLK